MAYAMVVIGLLPWFEDSMADRFTTPYGKPTRHQLNQRVCPARSTLNFLESTLSSRRLAPLSPFNFLEP